MAKNQKRQIINTAALIYANGSIHLGHLVEYIQADIWTRFQKMRGHEAYYVCGNDCHGTPIMLKAQKEDITPEELVKRVTEEQLADFSKFHIKFDSFASTHSEENKKLVYSIYENLKNNQDIETRLIKQAFDPEKNMFLPDRFVKGECPKCGAKDQYGDNCEACGATYDPTDLINPISALSGATPIEKESEHYFFKLNKYESYLKKWLESSGTLQTEVKNKLSEWFEAGLQDWDISRDQPYFGFEIPNTPGKYFYVWLDAPVGYMASFKKLCDKKNIDFDLFWNKNSNTELYHFIGKDIIYFHALFWPAMLHGSGHRVPTAIYAHSFLTVNGKKMSKSRGTFIKASTFEQHINPETLRYYFAAKLSNTIEDIDFNPKDFELRINSDLIGKFINIASRCAGFIVKKFDSKLCENISDHELLISAIAQNNKIAEFYENREYSHAMREIMSIADQANQYIALEQPWQLIKEDGKESQAHQVCSVAINLFKILVTYLKPVLPEIAKNSEEFLNTGELNWQDIHIILENHEINKFKPLLTRIEEESVNKMLEQAAQEAQEN